MTPEQVEKMVYDWTVELGVVLTEEQFDDLVQRLLPQGSQTIQ